MGFLLVAALLPLDLAVPTVGPTTVAGGLLGAVGRVELVLRAPSRARVGPVTVELVHENVGDAVLRLVDDDCDGVTNFLRVDGVEYPVHRPAGCLGTTRVLRPGERFSTFVALRAIAAPFHDLAAGPAAACGAHTLAASYRTNDFRRPADTWSGAVDADAADFEVVCPVSRR